MQNFKKIGLLSVAIALCSAFCLVGCTQVSPQAEAISLLQMTEELSDAKLSMENYKMSITANQSSPFSVEAVGGKVNGQDAIFVDYSVGSENVSKGQVYLYQNKCYIDDGKKKFIEGFVIESEEDYQLFLNLCIELSSEEYFQTLIALAQRHSFSSTVSKSTNKSVTTYDIKFQISSTDYIGTEKDEYEIKCSFKNKQICAFELNIDTFVNGINNAKSTLLIKEYDKTLIPNTSLYV